MLFFSSRFQVRERPATVCGKFQVRRRRTAAQDGQRWPAKHQRRSKQPSRPLHHAVLDALRRNRYRTHWRMRGMLIAVRQGRIQHLPRGWRGVGGPWRSRGARAYNGGLGQSSQRVPGTEPLVGVRPRRSTRCTERIRDLLRMRYINWHLTYLLTYPLKLKAFCLFSYKKGAKS